MKVCACHDVSYDELKEAMKKVGSDLEAIQDETDAGTSCESCLEEDCDIVDLPLLEAIEKAKKELDL